MKLPIALSMLLAVLTYGSPGLAAPPDSWDAARAPDARKEEATFAAALALLDQASVTRNPLVRHDFAATARSLLEGIHAERSPDMRRRFALGHALHWLDDDSRLIAIVRPAVDRTPDHPELSRALFDLAVAYARSNQPRQEIEMYDRYLEGEPGVGDRHTVLSNRAEAKLKLLDLDGAIADYRAAIAVEPALPLAHWGLAIAFDRAGNFPGAMDEARRAWELDREDAPSLDSPGVFFVPDYERFWYYALRDATRGTLSTHPADRKDRFDAAARHWETFLSRATSDDHWVPLAKARKRLAETLSARAQLEMKSADKRRPARSEPGVPERR